MPWPLASHISAILQDPRIAFRDPLFQAYHIERNALNQPRVWSGQFAVVYKGVDANGKSWAIRAFTSESRDRRNHYDQISAHLKAHRLRCLVDFEYRDRAIRSAGDGKWYPLIIMEWVSGDTLFKWARLQSQQGNSPALAKAAELWIEVANELAQASVSHGDLQHGNVMVTDGGQLKLVDYDCMCVPALVGRRNLEVGVEPYQHPGRNESTLLSLDLDNFSALAIYVALRALSVSPQLWQKHVERPGYDKLLFRLEDFQAPENSALYADIMRLPDKDLRDLTGRLFSTFLGPINQVPPLGQLVNSFTKVEQLLTEKKWEKAVLLLNRRGHFEDAPPRLKPLIHKAYEFVCRKQAWETYCKVPQKTSEDNDRQLVEAWNEKLFARFEAAERQRPRVAESRKRVTLLDRLNLLVQQTAKTITRDGEQRIVDAVAKLPQGYKYSLAARVEKAQRRVSAVARLDKMLEQSSSEAAIVAAWRAAEEAKCEKLVDAACRPRVELAERRAPVLKELYDLPSDLTPEERDSRLIKIWQEELLGDCREAERWRPLYEAAVARRELLAQLEKAVKAKDEAAILQLIEDPVLADHPIPDAWKKAIEKAKASTNRADDLFAALQAGQRSEFAELFDARILRAQVDRFEQYQAMLNEWTNELVLPPENLGLQPSAARPSIAPAGGPEGTYRVRWKWPPAGLTDQFILAVCPGEPGVQEVPQEVSAHLRLTLDRETWEKDGRSRVIQTKLDWIDCCVVAWAVIDLGFRAYYSQPLVIGRLEARSSWKWKGWNLLSSRGGKTADADPDGSAPTETEDQEQDEKQQ